MKTKRRNVLEYFADLSYYHTRRQLDRAIFGGFFVLILLTYRLWRLMLPLWLVAAAVAAYLRFSRPKDSL